MERSDLLSFVIAVRDGSCSELVYFQRRNDDRIQICDCLRGNSKASTLVTSHGDLGIPGGRSKQSGNAKKCEDLLPQKTRGLKNMFSGICIPIVILFAVFYTVEFSRKSYWEKQKKYHGEHYKAITLSAFFVLEFLLLVLDMIFYNIFL